jgi:uncharacterized protein (DUF488 family)
MKIYTIGFTKKSAESFFETLRRSGATRLVDVRLNNVSQLAGFTKKQDLPYFLKTICNMEYTHLPILAPTQELLGGYKKDHHDWQWYEQRFLDVMKERRVEDTISPDTLDNSCLLCSEAKPQHCHRRLVAEYLKSHWADVEITHLE